MARGGTEIWMWSEACEELSRAERMHRQFFQLARSRARVPAWEPPVDLFETAREVLAIVALPGVDPDGAQVSIEDGTLVVIGQRGLPDGLGEAVIHRMELPHGRFERRIPLPAGRFNGVRRTARNGCLLVSLQKAG